MFSNKTILINNNMQYRVGDKVKVKSNLTGMSSLWWGFKGKITNILLSSLSLYEITGTENENKDVNLYCYVDEIEKVGGGHTETNVFK